MKTITSKLPIPMLGYDNDNGPVFDDGHGNKYLAWGVDACNWTSTDLSVFHAYCDALVAANCTFIAIPIHWKAVEPAQDVYVFSTVQQQFDLAQRHGLKVVAYWYGSNFASGDNQFVPSYIMDDTTTYRRVEGACFATFQALCPNCAATLDREKRVYRHVVTFVKEYNQAHAENLVLSMLCGGEQNVVQSLPHWEPPQRPDVRCYCSTCNSLYADEGDVPFLTNSFAQYVKAMIDDAATTGYDLPTYSQVCPQSWFPGWRYAENPHVLKSIINRRNHFVVPSVADCSSIAKFVTDMSDFTPANIPGNIVFADGMPHGAFIDGNVECAPWISLLYYGGLGAIYWDSGKSNWDQSLLNNATLQNKYRTCFGPLKGIAYHLARLKSSPTHKFWWMPGESDKTGTITNYSLHVWNSNNDYGVFFDLGTNEFCFAGSTSSGPYALKITKSGGFRTDWTFESGTFHMTTGAWIPYREVEPTFDDASVIFHVNGDSGLADRVVIRGLCTTANRRL